jgi:hypothetical protein|tara:strand:- start:65 stop:280 length:216 start_codon:yes stop_codon:yes gene_type:complete
MKRRKVLRRVILTSRNERQQALIQTVMVKALVMVADNLQAIIAQNLVKLSSFNPYQMISMTAKGTILFCAK